jgi:large subunit ribosomal protein L10
VPKPKKVEAVKRLADQMTQAQLVVLTDYRGLSVAEISQLRRRMRESGTRIEVAKNTLLKLAANQVGIDEPFNTLLEGPTAVAFVQGTDLAQPAKAITDYARVSKVFTIKGAALGKRTLSVDQVQQLADLPPREVLLARVVGGVQAPIAGLVTVLGGTVRGLLYTLQARREQLEAQQGG